LLPVTIVRPVRRVPNYSEHSPAEFAGAPKFIVQRGGDGGDTAQREGFAWFET
jgi:hypothetical protein